MAGRGVGNRGAQRVEPDERRVSSSTWENVPFKLVVSYSLLKQECPLPPKKNKTKKRIEDIEMDRSHLLTSSYSSSSSPSSWWSGGESPRVSSSSISSSPKSPKETTFAADNIYESNHSHFFGCCCNFLEKIKLCTQTAAEGWTRGRQSRVGAFRDVGFRFSLSFTFFWGEFCTPSD